MGDTGRREGRVERLLCSQNYIVKFVKIVHPLQIKIFKCSDDPDLSFCKEALLSKVKLNLRVGLHSDSDEPSCASVAEWKLGNMLCKKSSNF